MREIEVVEMSPSVAITWTFRSVRAARTYLLHDRGAELVQARYEVKDIYGVHWAHREYQTLWSKARFLMRERLS